MANIFSRPFITLGAPDLDTGHRFTDPFEAGDQVWYHLADGRVIKETGIAGIPIAPLQMNLIDVIRADYRNKDGLSKQTWLKVMPERGDDETYPKPQDFDGNSYENALFKHCYDPLADTPVSLSNGRDLSLIHI